MSKISCLFKPSRKSGISSDLQYLWYYDYNYREIYKIPIQELNNRKRFKIDKVDYDDLWNLYEYLTDKVKADTIIIIMVSINNLFEFQN